MKTSEAAANRLTKPVLHHQLTSNFIHDAIPPNGMGREG